MCGDFLCLVLVLKYSSQCHFKFFNHLAEEDRACWFTFIVFLMFFRWSVVCDCCISWSCLLAFRRPMIKSLLRFYIIIENNFTVICLINRI